MNKNSVLTKAQSKSTPHESASKHVSGQAIYVDDRLEYPNQLHLAVIKSSVAKGRISSIDLARVYAADGVVDVITVDDVPGKIDIGAVFEGDPLLTNERIEFYGQAICAVVANSYKNAMKAAKLADIKVDSEPPCLDVDEANETNHYVRPSHQLKRGDSAQAIAGSKVQLSGELYIGAQEHFYLEGQVTSVVPNEDGGMNVYTSSQHPSEVAILVAKVLGLPINKVVVDVRRMGGGFGGKETQAAQWACLAAIASHKTGKPVKMRLSRSDDMILTGKRHPFSNNYRVGTDEKGVINGIDIELNGDAGFSPDLTDAIVDRAMFHSDNAYYLDQVLITGNRCKTNKVSNTAFRGFGGPQGMITIEGIMDDIARAVGRDPLDVRKDNLYGGEGRDTTPYFQKIEFNNIAEIIERVERQSNYQHRRKEIAEFNKRNDVFKRGIALTPVKFGISFTLQMLNQAGALIHIYTDGSVHLNHGGTEMGQGLFTKIARVVADEFQIDVDRIQVSATRTDKVPNTSPTAASSGTDLNGQAARDAALTIKKRLIEFCCDYYGVSDHEVVFANNRITVGDTSVAFNDLVLLAYQHRISLSSTGFYRTPEIFYDRSKAKGNPFYYYSTGAAVSEVLIDTLTGEYRVLRTDITHDVGESLNEAIDIGQIEGGFIQGLGWLTTEELVWSDDGQLRTQGPATYKIPAVSDMPDVFNVELLPDSKNEKATIYHSKAVGEPPFMLSISVWCALRDAIASIADYKVSPQLDTPATPERVLGAISELKLKSLGSVS